MLTGLRKEVGEDLLLIDRDSVTLNADVVELAPQNGEEFLGGFHLADPAFEDWLRDERSAFQNAGLATSTTASHGVVETPKIAVLPFANLSRDPDQEFFSDGMTEDIITELNRFQNLFVISSQSSFGFRDHQNDLSDAGEKLGVEFLVQGSVRKAGDRIRISTQLVDAATGGQLWSERFDRDLTDIFAVQDEIASTVATMVSGHVEIAERTWSDRKHPKDVNAHDLVCRARLIAYKDYSSTDILKLLRRAVELDPDYATAHAMLALTLSFSVVVEAKDSCEMAPLVKKHGSAAAQLAPGDALVHAPLTEAFALVGEHELAAHHVERALSLNPIAFAAMGHSSIALAYLGDHAKAVRLIEEAMQRNPYSSLSFKETLFDIYFLAGRYDDAVAQVISWPDPPFFVGLSLAAALGQLGRTDEAKAAVKRLEAERPEGWDTDMVIRNIDRMCAKPEDRENWRQGFLKAGLNA